MSWQPADLLLMPFLRLWLHAQGKLLWNRRKKTLGATFWIVKATVFAEDGRTIYFTWARASDVVIWFSSESFMTTKEGVNLAYCFFSRDNMLVVPFTNLRQFFTGSKNVNGKLHRHKAMNNTRWNRITDSPLQYSFVAMKLNLGAKVVCWTPGQEGCFQLSKFQKSCEETWGLSTIEWELEYWQVGFSYLKSTSRVDKYRMNVLMGQGLNECLNNFNLID